MRVPILANKAHLLPSAGYFRAIFLHDLPEAKGPVDVVYFPPRSGRIPSTVIVFLPGNPGLIGYYPPFLKRLQTLIDPSYGIIGLSHLGHCPSLPHPLIPLTLREQIEAKCEFVRVLSAELALLQEEAKSNSSNGEDLNNKDQEEIRISLMGHSVGAEVCVQVMRRLEDPSYGSPDISEQSIRISALYLLFPTLANIARSPNGRRLRPMFHFPLIQILPLLAYLLKPLLWLVTVLESVGSPTSISASSIYAPHPTTLSFLSSPKTISHILHLAKSEMTTILDPDLGYYAEPWVKGRVWAYFGHEDGWVGSEADELKAVLRAEGKGKAKQRVKVEADDVSDNEMEEADLLDRLVDCIDGVPHAFCLGKEHNRVMAENVASFVRQAG